MASTRACLEYRDGTVDEVMLVPRECEQQLTAEQIGDVPQFRDEAVEVDKTALEERISERSEVIKVPKISRQGSVTESALTESSGEFHEVAKSSLDARPPGIAKQSATTESKVAVSSGGAGLSWSRARGTTSTADMAADAKSAVEAGPPGIAKHSAWTNPDSQCRSMKLDLLGPEQARSGLWKCPRSHARKTSRLLMRGCVKRS